LFDNLVLVDSAQLGETFLCRNQHESFEVIMPGKFCVFVHMEACVWAWCRWCCSYIFV